MLSRLLKQALSPQDLGRLFKADPEIFEKINKAIKTEYLQQFNKVQDMSKQFAKTKKNIEKYEKIHARTPIRNQDAIERKIMEAEESLYYLEPELQKEQAALEEIINMAKESGIDLSAQFAKSGAKLVLKNSTVNTVNIEPAFKQGGSLYRKYFG